jgi:predicted lipoprotein with Yx(FWY)xxD motif
MSTQDGNRGLRADRFPRTAKIRMAALVGAAAVLTACGSDAGAGSDSAEAPPDAPVRAQEHPELGMILVDQSGKTLYFSEQEENGEVRCAATCLQFWIPTTVEDEAAPSIPGVEDLDTVQRPDNNQTQLTFQGKPLYTFSMDEAAGEAKGDNLADDFDGTRFVWHAATVEGGAGGGDAPEEAPPGGGGY